MPAPVEKIHVDQGRISQLDDEDLVLRDRTDRIDVDLAGERMKTVENDADIGMIGTPDDFPSVTMIGDVPAPGKRLIADFQPAPGRSLAQFVKIRCGSVDASERNGRDVRADQNEIRPQFLHDVELPLGTVERPRAEWFRHALEIAERLEQGNLQPEITCHPTDIARTSIESEKIVLEDLDAVKAGLGNRLQLLRKFATD